MPRKPQTDDNTDGGFLGRWSRRKARSVQGSPDDDTGNGDVSAGMREAGGAGPSPEESRAPDGRLDTPEQKREEGEEQVKTDADMPDLESIDESTNMSDFFSPGVSEQLRNQALRRLFHTSKFNVVDPLDDYNENFRDFALLGDLVTSDMRHSLEMGEQRRREAESGPEETVTDAQDELVDKTTEAGPDAEDQDPGVQEGEAESERLAADSRRGSAPAAGGDESDGDSDVEARNKT